MKIRTIHGWRVNAKRTHTCSIFFKLSRCINISICCWRISNNMSKCDLTFKLRRAVSTDGIKVGGCIGLVLIGGIKGMLVTIWFWALSADSSSTGAFTCLSEVKSGQSSTLVRIALKSSGLIKRVTSSDFPRRNNCRCFRNQIIHLN